ncbi:hypothetical protein [Fibrella aquatilis]|uniref:Uncharacterized protein n=1 Tax=Fibrella aquatilis TaxID=2817059 RepID=A0A939G997_9BACT|nr:hypothetical protein [Fibrella aquatilis]MBO0934594.1 hypothetical protein [Fibrella aquatilis]
MSSAVLVLLLVFGWLVGNKARAANNLMIDWDLPQQVRIDNFRLVFIQPIVLTNLTATPLTIRGADMQFQTENGTPIGTAFFAGLFKVPPNGSVTLPVQVNCSIARLLTAFPEFRQQIKAKQLRVRYGGVVRAEGFTIPVSQTLYNYQLPDLSF